MITSVFIDIDDTLLDFGKCAEYSMRESFKDFSLKFDDYMFPVFEEINAGLWKQIEKGEIVKSDLYGKRWTTVLGKFGITHVGGDEFEEHFTAHLSKSAEKVEGADDLLKYLSSKYKVYAASNGPHLQQVKRLEKAGILNYFTDIFTSERFNISKPEKEFFDACFKEIGNENVNEFVLIGDSLTADIKGGVNLNMMTIWFNKHQNDGFPDIQPTHTVRTLREIVGIL